MPEDAGEQWVNGQDYFHNLSLLDGSIYRGGWKEQKAVFFTVDWKLAFILGIMCIQIA